MWAGPTRGGKKFFSVRSACGRDPPIFFLLVGLLTDPRPATRPVLVSGLLLEAIRVQLIPGQTIKVRNQRIRDLRAYTT